MQAAFGGDIGPKGQLWTTESVISGWMFGIIFAVELEKPYLLRVNECGWGPEVHSLTAVLLLTYISWVWPGFLDGDAP